MGKSNRKGINLKHRHSSVLTLLFTFGSQILFKDLFRFLLVYVLFMIGYASGRFMVTCLYRCMSFPQMLNYFFKCSQTHNPSSSLSTPQPWCPCWQCVLHRARSVTGAAPPTPSAGTQTPSVISCWTSLSWPLGWENWTWSTVHSIPRCSSSCWLPTSSSPSCCCWTCWSLWWGRRWDRCRRRARRSGSFRWAGSNCLWRAVSVKYDLML